jgi:hypothetical protein
MYRSGTTPCGAGCTAPPGGGLAEMLQDFSHHALCSGGPAWLRSEPPRRRRPYSAWTDHARYGLPAVRRTVKPSSVLTSDTWLHIRWASHRPNLAVAESVVGNSPENGISRPGPQSVIFASTRS